MKSRLFEAILLIILFVVGVIFFNAWNAPQPQEVPADGATSASQ